MKNLTSKTRVLLAISVVALVSVTSAYAETTSMRAHIPFQFRAGSALLPAGQYQVDYASAFSRLMLRATENGAGVYLPHWPTQRSATAPQSGMLVFHKYGEHYFLRQVWSPGQSEGYELPASKVERELARMEKAPPATEIVSATTALE